jgi:hypothetical protein
MRGYRPRRFTQSRASGFSGARKRQMVNHPNRKKAPKHTRQGLRYVTGIPRKPLPEGHVLVHNHVLPQYMLGLNGFRAWTQILDDTLMVCPCKWAGRDLHGLKHYRMAFANPWAWEDEALAAAMRKAMFAEMKGDKSAKAMMASAQATLQEWENNHPSA